MLTPAENLLDWLAERMLPLGVSAQHLLTEPAAADARPWYTPAMLGCATDEEGWNARQLAFGAEHTPASPATAEALKNIYVSVMTSRTPLRTALACTSAGFSAWNASRAYIVPYQHGLETHALALQLAVALRDFTGSVEVVKGNSYLVRSATHAYGVLEGRPVGARFKVPDVSTEDMQSLLLSPRAITLDTVRGPIRALRNSFDRVSAGLEEPELVRDAISILGLLTARSAWFCKLDRELSEDDRLEERLMSMIEDRWRKGRSRRDGIDRPTTRAQQLSAMEQDLRTVNEALAHLEDPSLSGYARLHLIHSTLVPALWGQATFEKRISSRTLSMIQMNPEMTERVRAALLAAKAVVQTRINRRTQNV